MSKTNINSNIDFKNLGDELTKTIASAFAAGSKKGLSSANFMQDLNDQMEDFNKQQEASIFNERVKNLALRTGLDTREVELKLMAKQAKMQAEQGGDMSAFYRITEIVDKRLEQLKTEKDLAKQSEIEEKAAERIKEIDHERSELMDSINEKISMTKLILTDQRALAAAGIATMIKGYESLSETFEEFRKEGLSVGQAMGETGVAVGAMFSLSGASLKENQEIMSGLAESMGNMHNITSDTVAEVGKLSKTLGVSALEAGKLQGQLQNMPGATAESATNTMEFAGALAMAAHVAPGAVMKDMAANAEDIAVNTKNGGKDMATVSVAAHKLGVEMSSLTKMSAGLLDFESSINKQMEASVLLGKEINLDKAREAALNGDILGATQEMLKNVGGEAEFNKMNVIQRKALADSMGVSVSDLSKMVKNQDELANLTEEQTQALADGIPLSEVLAANAGGFAGKIKDGALSVGGAVASFGEFSEGLGAAKKALDLIGNTKMAQWVMDKAIFAWEKTSAAARAVWAKMGGKPSTPPLPTPPRETDSLGAGRGAGGGMKGLASGLKSMAGGKVTQGIANLALFGLAAIPALLSIPFMVAVSLGGTTTGLGLVGLSQGLKGSGMGAALVSVGIANLALYGLAAVVGVLGIPFMIGVSAFGWLAGMGLKGLAGGLKAMGNPAVALGVGILSLLILSVGAGMLMFGIGVGVAAAGMSLLVTSLKDVPFENLLALPIAFMGIGAGLVSMAAAGLMALPIIGALTALAVVAPALSGLGASLGGMFGGGGGEKEDKMDTLITKIDTLITVASQGGTINMDGKKVGEVVRLGLNSSRIK